MKNAKDVIKRKAKKETAGQILSRYRESFELSQAALAELIETTQNNISAIENGKRQIGVNVAIQLTITSRNSKEFQSTYQKLFNLNISP